MKTRITKRLLFGLALALVLVSGVFISAGPTSFFSQTQARAATYAAIQTPTQATCQGSFRFGPTTPTPFGGVGGASGG